MLVKNANRIKTDYVISPLEIDSKVLSGHLINALIILWDQSDPDLERIFRQLVPKLKQLW